VQRSSVSDNPPLSTWRDVDAVMTDEEPSDVICKEASDVGVLMVAALSSPDSATTEMLSRLSRYPAVALLFVGGQIDARIAPNALVARLAFQGEQAVGGTFDVGVCPWDDGCDYMHFAGERPTLVMRPLERPELLVDARRQCDVLQADLAQKCNAAGYIV
jgi:hypothetical protein